MSQLAAEYAAMDKSIGKLSDTAAALTNERRSLETSMHSMLDGEWTGAAAAAFESAFNDWGGGAQSVLDGLQAMSQLIEQAKRLLQANDGNVSQTMAALHSRLGGS